MDYLTEKNLYISNARRSLTQALRNGVYPRQAHSAFRILWIRSRDYKRKYEKQIAMMANEAMGNSYGNITRDQLIALGKVLDILGKDSVTLADAKYVHRLIIESGMDYIPDIPD